jgi:ABC-type multidrug transport system ATPase subunit
MISLSDCGKRFSREWVFRKLTFQFTNGNSYAITGPNGSGKSTLLQVICGAIIPSEGVVSYSLKNGKCNSEDFYTFMSIAAPSMELIEEMTLREFLQFHNIFKPFLIGKDPITIISKLGLQKAADKQIVNYSSGMKQRVKIAQAIFSDTPCILLDEPCTNLDSEGIQLYRDLIDEYCANRLIIVSSNDPQEYTFCRETINILDFKY